MITSEMYLNLDCVKKLKKEIDKNPFRNSVFWDLYSLSSRKKGAQAEKIVKEFFSKVYGLNVRKCENSDHDFILEDIKTEHKMSALWVDSHGNTTVFRWQQIRTVQDYELMIFMAVYPDKIRLFYATKQDLLDNLDPFLNNQHGGKKTNSGTMFIDGLPEDFVWMKEITDASFVKHGLSGISKAA